MLLPAKRENITLIQDFTPYVTRMAQGTIVPEPAPPASPPTNAEAVCATVH